MTRTEAARGGRRMLAGAGVMLALTFAVACGQPADGSPGGGSPDGREEPAQEARPAGQVTFPSGRVFYVDLAVTLQEQMKGYMGRRRVGPDEGMLFIYKDEGIHKFWMKNCLTALDIIWLDRQGRVIAIEHSAPPCGPGECPSLGPDRPSFTVLEVAPGVAREEGLETGSQLGIVTDQVRP